MQIVKVREVRVLTIHVEPVGGFSEADILDKVHSIVAKKDSNLENHMVKPRPVEVMVPPDRLHGKCRIEFRVDSASVESREVLKAD